MSTENQNNQASTGQSQSGQSDASQGAAQQGGQQGRTVQDLPGLDAAQAQRDAAAAQQGGQGQGAVPSGMTPDQISALVRSAVGEVAQQHAPQDPPEVMMAKFNKAFNVYNFDPDKLAKLGYAQDQIELIRPVYEDMRDGLVRQAVTMSNYQIGLLKEELVKMFQPALASAQSQMEEKLKGEFLAANKDLVGYEPLLEEIKTRYVAQNRQFKTKEELFSTIATEAKGIISKVFAKGGQSAQQGNGGAGQQQQQGSHRMSTVSAGGQGGAGGQAAGTGDKPGWLKALE